MRRKSLNTPYHAHELTFSTYRRVPIFSERDAARIFLENLNEARHAAKFDLYAFVVMPEHCHVLVRPQEEIYQVGDILRAVKSPAAKAIFEWRPSLKLEMTVERGSRTESRLWQKGGGYDRNVWSTRAIVQAISYIHDNPVRRGLCDSQLEWPYSSAGAYYDQPTLIPVDICDWHEG